MCSRRLREWVSGQRFMLAGLLVLCAAAPSSAQTMAVLQGRVFDASGAVLPAATITVRSQSAGFVRSVTADPEGRYRIDAIPAGPSEVTAAATGFRSEVIEELTFEVGRTLVRDFRLAIGDRSESLVVRAELPLLDRATSTVGHMVSAQTIQEIPLNGRHYVDLGPLVPGSVAPSQTGFSTTPIRGTGALAFNTAGNREEAVGYVVNGVTTNNLTFGSIGFPPPIASIQEFKVDNSTFSAEYGHVSGAIVNLITRSGTDQFHGERVRVLPERRARCQELLRVHVAGTAPLRAKPVRRIAGRSHPSRPHLFLRHLRGTATASGTRREQPGAQRRAARCAQPTPSLDA